MAHALPTRSYRLHLRLSGAHCDAWVERLGPSDLLRVGLGRAVDDAPRLAGLLFALCPRAHGVAALRAIEQAGGIALPPGQAAAREILLLSESVAALVWRYGLPQGVGAEDVAAVRQARQSADALSDLLFQEDWRQPGGGVLKPVARSAVRAIIEDLAAAYDRVSPSRVLPADLADAGADCPALGADIADPALEPDDHPREETPRRLMGDGADPGCWVSAQQAYGLGLQDRLREAVDRLDDAAPARITDAISGTGLGLADTARGRLRHIISLDEGQISAWRATAPTDWNLAPHGPLSLACRRLPVTKHAPDQVRSLINAFDPCAPCDLAVEDSDA